MARILPFSPPPSHEEGKGPPGESGPQKLGRLAADEAQKKAKKLLSDDELSRLLSTPREGGEVERARQIFVNRNLRMSKIDLIGFDMDYTLAIYHMRRIEQLSFDMTLAKLITQYRYPAQLNEVTYDHQFVMRGLSVDKGNGNLFKMDRFGYVGRAYHGRQPLSDEVWRRLYREVRVQLKNPQYAWIDTLFALPEACLFAGAIEVLEARGIKVDYAKLYDDIREAIDTVHRDNSLKQKLRQDIGHYIFKDPELGPTLHKLRSGGKKLFLLTNSFWEYTNVVLQYLLDGMLPEYPTWRHYFDFVITGAAKPSFFSGNAPFLEVDHTAEGRPMAEAKSLDRWKVYQGGNLADFERMTGFTGENVLYVGDHIYGDILKSKKTSLWRTCMIVQELEDEINYTDARQDEISRLSEIELMRARIDDQLNQRKAQLNIIERKLEKNELNRTQRRNLQEDRRRAKAEVEKLRRAARDAIQLTDSLEHDVEAGFNPYWGLLFKEGNENSRFGQQVEQYACLYTSRVSNFFRYSPMQYYRSPRDLMPHEQAGALSAKLSPLGSEGPAIGSNKD